MNNLKCFLACTLLIAGNALAIESVPKPEYRQRRIALSEKLHGGVALVFAGQEPSLDFMPFRQDSDFYYLSGWNEPGAALLVIGPGPGTTTRLGDLVPGTCTARSSSSPPVTYSGRSTQVPRWTPQPQT